MTIEARVILGSVGPAGRPIYSIQARYPRFIHAEELTHRLLRTTPDEIEIQRIADGFMYDENLSRNASSSRAIPVDRVIKTVLEDPVIPIHWGKNQPGMQAREECNAPIGFNGDAMYFTREEAWLFARDNAISIARAFSDAGYHKQIVNRLLEP